MVFNPSGPISFTKTTLSYPVYTVDFDPYNRGYIVVAGGGGEGRSGVGNKITVLDTTSRQTLDTVTEIDLSRDEDSVTTVASLGSKDGLVVLAGINSSEAEQKSGKNEHLRTFQVTYPAKKRPGNESEKETASPEANISFAGKTALFKPATGPKPETYQRLLRLSPAYKRESGNRRIGAIATGLAKESEVIIFDATRTPPTQAEVISRVRVRGNAEAADLDITEYDTNSFSVIWCTDYEVFEQTVMYNFATRKAEFLPPNPRLMHSIPLREDPTSPPRSKFRSIRFLTNEDILLLTNLPNKKGAELQILHLYPSGPAALLFHKILPSNVKQAVGLDVCALDADANGNRQIVVAVASQDISINLYTINFNGITRTFSPFQKFTTLRDVHPLQMTSIRLSPFHSPNRAPAPTAEEVKNGERKAGVPVPAHPGPQYIKLCSASMGNTVVVETMALTVLEPSKRNSRYVLAHPSDGKYLQTAYLTLGAFVALVTAILIQSLFFPDTTPMTSLIPAPQSIKNLLSRPATLADSLGHTPVVETAESLAHSAADLPLKLADLLHLHIPSGSADAAKKALMLRDGPDGASSSEVSVDVIPDREAFLKQDTQARQWHDLAEHEKEAWRQRLVDAGHWSVEEGEKVLKGLLFGSWAGFVGRVAGEAIREL